MIELPKRFFDLVRMAVGVAGVSAPLVLLRYFWLSRLNRTSRRRPVSITPTQVFPDAAQTNRTTTTQAPRGDIVVPIFDNYDDTAHLLTQLATATDFDGHVILVDDASPDPRIASLLDQFAKTRSNVIVLRNPQNLGFVGACNRGLTESNANVVILNTDIVLPDGAIGRLLEAVGAAQDIATVTPFSSHAYGLGFPYLLNSNPMPFGATVTEVDSCFQQFAHMQPVTVPSGVGFCMAMSRRAMNQVGVFDTHFGTGYGEETDFCLRAAAKGYRNVAAPNVYVFHKAGQSFGGSWQNKARLGLLRVLHRHPHYPRLVANYLARGDAAAISFSALCALSEMKADRPLKIIDNNTSDTERLAEQSPNQPFLIHHKNSRRPKATLHYAGEQYTFHTTQEALTPVLVRHDTQA